MARPNDKFCAPGALKRFGFRQHFRPQGNVRGGPVQHLPARLARVFLAQLGKKRGGLRFAFREIPPGHGRERKARVEVIADLLGSKDGGRNQLALHDLVRAAQVDPGSSFRRPARSG